MKDILKIIFDNVKVALICAALIVSCLTFLYAHSQFDHLRLQVEVVSSQVETINKNIGELTIKINEVEKNQENARIFFDKVQLENIETNTKLFMLESEMNRVDRTLEANYACYYLQRSAKQTEKRCKVKSVKKDCEFIEKYKNSCFKINKYGQRIISPNPDIYSQMLLEVVEKENKNVKPKR